MKVISLSRNFGYHAVLLAGLSLVPADLYAMIDVDCEDPPELLLEFFRAIEGGADIAYGIRSDRVEPAPVTFFRRIFYYLNKWIADSDIVVWMAEFAMLTRQVRDVILAPHTTYIFLRAEIGYAGFVRVGVPYVRAARTSGKTHYNLWNMTRFAVSGFLADVPAALDPLRRDDHRLAIPTRRRHRRPRARIGREPRVGRDVLLRAPRAFDDRALSGADVQERGRATGVHRRQEQDVPLVDRLSLAHGPHLHHRTRACAPACEREGNADRAERQSDGEGAERGERTRTPLAHAHEPFQDEALLESQAVQATLDPAQRIVLERSERDADQAEPGEREGAPDGIRREVAQVSRDIEVHPIATGNARLPAGVVRKAEHKRPAWSESGRCGPQRRERVSEVLEDMEHDHEIEHGRRPHCLEIADEHRHAGRGARCRRGLRAALAADRAPAALAQRSEHPAGAAAYLQREPAGPQAREPAIYTSQVQVM